MNNMKKIWIGMFGIGTILLYSDFLVSLIGNLLFPSIERNPLVITMYSFGINRIVSLVMLVGIKAIIAIVCLMWSLKILSETPWNKGLRKVGHYLWFEGDRMGSKDLANIFVIGMSFLYFVLLSYQHTVGFLSWLKIFELI